MSKINENPFDLGNFLRSQGWETLPTANDPASVNQEQVHEKYFLKGAEAREKTKSVSNTDDKLVFEAFFYMFLNQTGYDLCKSRGNSGFLIKDYFEDYLTCEISAFEFLELYAVEIFTKIKYQI